MSKFIVTCEYCGSQVDEYDAYIVSRHYLTKHGLGPPVIKDDFFICLYCYRGPHAAFRTLVQYIADVYNMSLSP